MRVGKRIADPGVEAPAAPPARPKSPERSATSERYERAAPQRKQQRTRKPDDAKALVEKARDKAERASDADDFGGVLKALAGWVDDARLAPADRAEQARFIASNALAAGDATAAELFYLKARDTGDTSVAIGRLHARILTRRGENEEALQLVEELLAREPNNADLVELQADILLDLNEPAEAVVAARRAVALVDALADAPAGQVADVRAGLGQALIRTRNFAEAAEHLRAALAEDPLHPLAHCEMATLVLPAFDSPARPTIEKKLAEMERCHQAGVASADMKQLRAAYERVQVMAREILALDPNEGLAHSAIDCASGALAPSTRQEWLPPLATAERREALIRELERALAPRQPRDLFPDWDRLVPLQRATVALSVLPYAAFFPAVLARGIKYHLVGIGTSCTTRNLQIGRNDRLADGRYYYAMRGYATDGVGAASSTSDCDDAARGGYNTIAHEFAHIVHSVLLDSRDTVRRAPHQATSEQLLRSAWATRIDELFAETKQAQSKQVFLDDYSETDEWEYFAQGAMAYINPLPTGRENAGRLFSRNPSLWYFVRGVLHASRRAPPEVPAISHPEVGLAEGKPLALHALVGTEVVGRAAAAALLAWQAGYAAGTRPPPEHEARLRQRTSDLVAASSGTQSLNHVTDAAFAIRHMSRDELLAQLALERAVLAKRGDRNGAKRADQVVATATRRRKMDVEWLRQEVLALHESLEPPRR